MISNNSGNFLAFEPMTPRGIRSTGVMATVVTNAAKVAGLGAKVPRVKPS